MAARHHLSRRDARRIAVRAQPPTQPQPTDVLDVLRHLTLLHLPVPRRVGGVARPEPLSPWQVQLGEWLDANAASRAEILDRLAVDGPMPSAELPTTCAVPRRSSGWKPRPQPRPAARPDGRAGARSRGRGARVAFRSGISPRGCMPRVLRFGCTTELGRGLDRVDAIHEDGHWSAARRRRVRAEVESLAAWMGLRTYRN